jgi:hypothetical protein
MIKKVILFGAIVALILLIGPRLIALSLGAWDYYNTDVSCPDVHLLSSMGQLESQLPLTMLVFEVKPYAVLTDRGYMFPGDEYQAYGEGHWYGSAILLFLGMDGATFLVSYPVDDPISDYSRQNCRSFVPVRDYR